MYDEVIIASSSIRRSSLTRSAMFHPPSNRFRFCQIAIGATIKDTIAGRYVQGKSRNFLSPFSCFLLIVILRLIKYGFPFYDIRMNTNTDRGCI
jgi:hypothetical protein